MPKKFKLNRWIKTRLKLVSRVTFILVVLIGSIWLLLQTAYMQNYLMFKATTWVSTRTGHKVSIDNIRISWFDEVAIEGFLLKDYKDSTLLQVERMSVNYDLWYLIDTKNLELEEIHLKNGAANLINYADSSEMNLSVFLTEVDKLTASRDSLQDSTAAKPIFLKQLSLENFRFSMHDRTVQRTKSGPDFSHIDLLILRTKMNDISLKPDSISLHLAQFMGADPANGIHINEFSMKVGYSDTQLILDDLIVRTPYSSFGDSVALSYPRASALSSFVDSVQFYVRIPQAVLGVHDFRFLTGSDALKDDVAMSAVLYGSVPDVRMRQLSITSGRSYLQGDISLLGMPTIEETFIDLNIRKSSFFKQDMIKYAGNQPMIEALERMDVVMTFAGFLNDFSTKLTVDTPHGSVYADMNVTVPKDKDETSYTGHLELRKLDVGRIIGDTALIQTVNLRGRVIGKGITQETATFITDLSATKVGLKGYTYDSLGFKGFLASRHFYGQFAVKDPNCKIVGRTNVDMRKSPEKLSLNATIDTLYTKALNLTEQDIFLKTRINWQQTHLNPDSLQGSLRVTDTFFRLDSAHQISLSELKINTTLEADERKLHLEMPGISLDLNGSYTFLGLASFLQKESNDLISYFQLAYYQKQPPQEILKANLKVKFGDLKPYTNFAAPALTISKGATLDILMEQREASDAIVSIYAHFDSIKYDKAVFYDNTVDIYASLSQDSGDILAAVLLASEKQKWDAVPNSEKFLLEGVWLNNTLDLTTKVRQPETNTIVNVGSRILVSTDSIELVFKPSELTALGRTWRFDPANHVTFSNRGLEFRTLDLISGPKRASLNGLLSETEHSTVTFQARNIDLLQFNSVLGIPMEGIFEADVSIFKEPNSHLQFEGDFKLSSFVYKGNKIGDVSGHTRYDLTEEGISAKLSIERENVKTINVEGRYYPERAEQLDFALSFDRADMKMLEVVSEGNLENVSGSASGKMKIVGATDAPKVTGNCAITDAGFKVVYLGTYYQMAGNIVFTERMIDLQNFILRDFSGDVATLQGNIRHKNFDEIVTNLQINAKNFMFLNTTSLDNSLYYGSAKATGTISVTGPIDDLVLKVNAKTEKGTKFYIPLSDSDTYEQAEFMTFVNLSDTSRNSTESLEVIEKSFGLTIDFDLEVTQDAYCELIFDIKTGDIIRGRGNGNLKLKLDKNGNFELFGPLTLTEGAYNFTVPNFINKEFQVVPGSTINWYGDPVAGVMDLKATYMQRASFGEYRSSTPQTQEESQKYPVLVVLELSGPMLTPNLDFDIQLHESVTPTAVQTQILAEIRSDEQKLKQQAVALMLLRRFSPAGQSIVTGGGSSGGIGSSVSEFLTNQIGYLASQLDENLEVEVDLSNMDQQGFETFQLRLAYTFMDGRMKVTRGGDFMSANNQSNGVSDIIGDWSVEYSLTKDGKLRAKMFSQTNRSSITSSGQMTMETGLSLKYITSFNTFKDLMTRTRNEAIQRKEEEAEEENIDEGTLE